MPSIFVLMCLLYVLAIFFCYSKRKQGSSGSETARGQGIQSSELVVDQPGNADVKLFHFYVAIEQEITELLLVGLLFLSENQAQFESIAEYEARHHCAWSINVGLPVICSLRSSLGGQQLVEGIVRCTHEDGSVDLAVHSPTSCRNPLRVHRDTILFTKNPVFQFESYFGGVNGAGVRSGGAQTAADSSQPGGYSSHLGDISSEYSSEIIAPEIGAKVSHCTTAHLLRVLCYCLALETMNRAVHMSDDHMNMLQALAEICLAALVDSLKCGIGGAASSEEDILDNLELILRALQFAKTSSVALSATTTGTGRVTSTNDQIEPFFLREDWQELASGVVSHLVTVGVVNRANEGKKSPEKVITKR